MATEMGAIPSVGDETRASVSVPQGAALGETVKAGLDRAGVLVRDGELFRQVSEDIVEFARRQPMMALLIATGVGLFIGVVLVQVRRAERRMPGFTASNST